MNSMYGNRLVSEKSRVIITIVYAEGSDEYR